MFDSKGHRPVQHPEGFDDGDAFMQKMRSKMIEKAKKMEGKKKGSGSGSGSAATGDTDAVMDNDVVDFEGDDEDGPGGNAGGEAILMGVF